MDMMDVFRGDAFSTVSLTRFVEKYPYAPRGLGRLNIFEPMPIRNTALAVAQRDGVLKIIPTSARGAPATERQTEKRTARYFDVPRLAHSDTIFASEIQNVRDYVDTNGEMVSVEMQLVTEAARRLSGPTGLQMNVEVTKEKHRLGALQGILYDSDGSTVIYNWFTEFGIAQPTEVAFDMLSGGANAGTGTLRKVIAGIKRGMLRASKGAIDETTPIYALCGDSFWDTFIDHPDVTRTYLNWSAAQEVRQNTAFEALYFAGIYWFNYRGTDDNDATAGVAVPSAKVKFFPVGAPGVFQVAYAPGESFQWANQPGRPEYVIPIIDRDRNAWFKQELYSYPLHICTRPEVLYSGRVGS